MKGSPVVSVAFPFRGPDWIISGIYYEPSLNIFRAGNTSSPILIITSSEASDSLCDGWSVQLDQCEIPLTPACRIRSVGQVVP